MIWEPRDIKNDDDSAWWLLLGGLIFIGVFWVRAWVHFDSWGWMVR